ncbi:MAG: CRTAC1 family protein [Pirellulaceae bacterium]
MGQACTRLAVAIGIASVLLVPTFWRQDVDLPPEVAAEMTDMEKRCQEREREARRFPGYFTDVTDEVSLDFQHVIGPLGTYFVGEINGAGGAFFDYDDDGDLDIYLVNSGRSPKAVGEFPAGTRVENRLFRQEADGRLVDVTDVSGLGDTGYGTGCAVGDIDNDGDLDVYVTNYGPDGLFRNNGDGTFTNVTVSAGIDESAWSTGVAFWDYDRDGWLDLFVVRYLADPFYGHSVACGYRDGAVSYCGPLKFVPEAARLYHNEGLRTDEEGQSQVVFRNVTVEGGIDTWAGAGFMVFCADFTGDGLPDAYVANDKYPNRLWVNRGDGTFEDEALARGVALDRGGSTDSSMGLAVGDIDNDGDFDIISTVLTSETLTLYLNDGTGHFSDQSRERGLDHTTMVHTSWGVALLDIDHDGFLDLLVANGLVVPCELNFGRGATQDFQFVQQRVVDTEAFWRSYYDFNQLFLNDGQGKFVQSSCDGGDFCYADGSARALICGDYDNDGDRDLLITYCGQRARLYRNDTPKRGHWLGVRATIPDLRRDAYGAVITVVAATGRWLGVLQPASSYAASHDPRVHFGLGAVEQVDAILVGWPDGTSERFPGGPVDRYLVVQQGDGEVIDAVKYMADDGGDSQ